MSDQKAGKYACFEFERKFLLKELPDSLKHSSDFKLIEDRYFAGTQLRLRIVKSQDGKITDRKLTQKYINENSDLKKTIITNIYLSESEAELLEQLQGKILKKKRCKLEIEGHQFSVDEFVKPFGLVLAEIEFETEVEMNQFTVPFAEWKEVSLDVNYSGGYLAAKYGQ